MYSGKRILFGAPLDFGFSETIKKELEILGFTVYDVSPLMHRPFRYKSLEQRLHNFYRKTIFQDYEFKRKLKAESRLDDLLQLLGNMPVCDFGLFIRPDFFPIDFLKQAKEKVGFMVAYQWDGFRRYPSVRRFIPLFDKFYAFDAMDVDYKRTFPITNFYFPLCNKHEEITCKKSYFVGSYQRNRIKKIIKLADVIKQAGYQNDILLSAGKDDKEEILRCGFTHLHKGMSYPENIKRAREAELLIDIHNPVHNGLSFRTFEALGYNKKLITTNTEVLKYDFYNPDNIFVLGEDSEEDLIDFIRQPYQIADSYLKEKYSFNNWVKYIFKLEDFIPIDLPICKTAYSYS